MNNFLHVGFTFVSAVMALPNGAPVCNIGPANVQNQHLRRTPSPHRGGTNEFGGYQIILAGAPLLINRTDPTFANLFQSGGENQLVIQSGVGNYFKGIFVIASGGDPENVDILDTRTPQALTITDTIRTKESIGCSDNFNVSSIVHTEPSEKNNLNMNFKWLTAGQKLYLDVNIVKNNNDTAGSQFYFTQYPMIGLPRIACRLSPCGLFGLSIFCPLRGCGRLKRWLGLCDLSCTF